MLKKICVGCGAGMFSLLAVLSVSGQEVATIVLRDGQRPSGELVDLNAGGFTLRVNGQDRTFPSNDVAAVEFAGGPPPPDAKARLEAGQALVVLRSGEVVDGRLVDIGGTHPLRLTVDTPSGQREFMSTDVAQVYLFAARQTSGSVNPSHTETPVNAIVVQGNQPWTNSGIRVKKGETIAFSGGGDIMIAAHASSGVGGSPAVTSPLSRYPVPGAPVGALIGRIGNGKPFAIGANSQPMAMAAAGQLFLGVNDDHFEDNSGTYTVTLTH